MAVDQRLVSARLLRIACSARASPKSARSFVLCRSQRARRTQTRPTGRLLSLHGAILLPLSRRLTRQRGREQRDQSHWLSLCSGRNDDNTAKIARPEIHRHIPIFARSYSALSACIGSSRDARHAGTIHANAATASSVAATAAKTAGSSGLIS